MCVLPRPLKPTAAIRIWLLTSARALIGSTLQAAAAPAACFRKVRRDCLDIAELLSRKCGLSDIVAAARGLGLGFGAGDWGFARLVSRDGARNVVNLGIGRVLHRRFWAR